MTLTRNAWSLQPDGGRDADAEISATCLCGHGQDEHGLEAYWHDGACEAEGCPCGRFRRCDEMEEEDGL